MDIKEQLYIRIHVDKPVITQWPHFPDKKKKNPNDPISLTKKKNDIAQNVWVW